MSYFWFLGPEYSDKLNSKLPSSLTGWLTSLSLIRFTDTSPPLLQAWTLFHEVAFYGIFSLLILNRRLGFVAMSLFMIACIFFYHNPPSNVKTPFNTYTAVYNLYFIFGMGAYWLYRRGGSGVIEFFLGVCVTTLAFFTMPLPHGISSISAVFGFALILAGSVKLESSNILRIPFFLCLIGDASYTIYLTHANVMGVLLKIAKRIELPQSVGPNITYFVVLTGTVILGCLIYLTIEKPLLKLFRRGRLPEK
jgi:peptidoglycan/LPS O-acetylase OafA/YrhL